MRQFNEVMNSKTKTSLSSHGDQCDKRSLQLII